MYKLFFLHRVPQGYGKNLNTLRLTLELRIDGTPRILIIPFFVTLLSPPQPYSALPVY